MRVQRTLLALSLSAAPSACAASDDRSDVQHARNPAPVEVDDPMASFARMVGGAWQVTLASGVSGVHAWQWGPGQHSMRRMTYSDAAANPWQGEVMYWHPGLGQVRLLSLHEDIPAVGRGVAEGAIWFDGETSHAIMDLDQPRGRRKLGQSQIFDGPDTYHEILLEDGGAGLQPLNALDFVRIQERPKPPPSAEPANLEFPEHWKPFEALVRSTWETDGAPASGGAVRIRSTFEWMPSLEVVFARTHALNAKGEATPLLDAYVYRDVRTDALRCLALWHRGSVYEGNLTVLDGGAMQFDLKLYKDIQAVRHVARFDLEQGGHLRTRLWSLEGDERTLELDVAHQRLDPERD